MNNLVSVDTSHPIAASIFCGLACSEPRKAVQGINTCHQWLHAGRPLNDSEYVLWHVCSCHCVIVTSCSCSSCLQPDLFNTFQQQQDELGTVVLPSLGTNSDRDWLCDSHSPPSNASPYSYSMNLDSDGALCADGHVFQYGMEDSDRSMRVGMGIARRVDPDADGLDRDVHDSDLHVHGIRGVTRTGPSGLLTSLIQRWNPDISCTCSWWANSGDDGRPSVWTGTGTWSRTRAVHWDAVSPSLSIHEACHGMRALSQVQPGQGHVDSDPAAYCLETLSMAHGLHDMDTLGHLESERRGPLNRHRAPSRATGNDRQTLSAFQDPHEARGVGVIVKALVQQNAGVSLFLRTIVCVAALLCCAHSMLVLGERPSFITDKQLFT